MCLSLESIAIIFFLNTIIVATPIISRENAILATIVTITDKLLELSFEKKLVVARVVVENSEIKSSPVVCKVQNTSFETLFMKEKLLS